MGAAAAACPRAGGRVCAGTVDSRDLLLRRVHRAPRPRACCAQDSQGGPRPLVRSSSSSLPRPVRCPAPGRTQGVFSGWPTGTRGGPTIPDLPNGLLRLITRVRSHSSISVGEPSHSDSGCSEGFSRPLGGRETSSLGSGRLSAPPRTGFQEKQGRNQ